MSSPTTTSPFSPFLILPDFTSDLAMPSPTDSLLLATQVGTFEVGTGQASTATTGTPDFSACASTVPKSGGIVVMMPMPWGELVTADWNSLTSVVPSSVTDAGASDVSWSP